ncbi:MAG: 4-(cytidine 5'-diphospho)-2-C-methyl-D-erythritol kinase, partial [Cyclobacteriaceae bacterium]|nr:4-(cytidine 5'-diphospho)-2-C-methyl-D-erythritol kinase [Cyclobacteriaceae bacterium]
MVGFPHAKINLGLQVIEKRHDGFHNIISCLYPIGWCDVLEVLPAPVFSINSSGLEIPGDPQQNLCIKAYQLLKESHNIPAVQIH